MDEKKEKEPSIRFVGFHDDWEQRKLIDMCSLFTDGDWIESKDQSVQGVRLLQTGNVGVTEFVEKANNKKWVSDDTFDRLHCTEVLPGDVLISRLPEPAGRACIVPNLMNRMITAVDCTIVRTSQEFDSEYLVQYLSTSAYFHEVNNCLAGGTRQRISRSNLANFDISVPSQKTEQKAIGNLFNHLDNIITLHQRELELLKENKKAMLQKMFPKEGADVPEIRFAGFNEAWEQRKLGEVAKYRNGKAHENDISEDGKYFVVNSKFVSTDGKVKKFSNQQIEPLYKGELAFVLSDVPNGRAIARTFLVDKDDKYSLNQRIAGITPLDKTDSYFLHILMNRHPYFLRFDDGAKQTNLSVNDVMEFETYYPSFDEQAKIGVYFLTLDNLITLHQRELDATKKLKKLMLQKMFM